MRTWINKILLVGGALALASGCTTGQGPPVANQTTPLSRGQIMARFQACASEAELRQLAELRASRTRESSDQAVVLVLSKLTLRELEHIGVVKPRVVPEIPPADWVVAGYVGNLESPEIHVITAMLEHAHISYGIDGNMGCLDVLVPCDHFFQARRTLLSAKDDRVRRCVVAAPMFQL